jgi:O-antigen ligase
LTTSVAAGCALLAIVVIGIAAGLPGTISDKWDNFKSQGSGSENDSRGTQILDFNGSGRYQFWEAAIGANKTDPLIGIGPGTFQFWWAKHGSYAAPVVDAHSLYIETLGELGIVGLVLIGGSRSHCWSSGRFECSGHHRRRGSGSRPPPRGARRSSRWRSWIGSGSSGSCR